MTEIGGVMRWNAYQIGNGGVREDLSSNKG